MTLTRTIIQNWRKTQTAPPAAPKPLKQFQHIITEADARAFFGMLTLATTQNAAGHRMYVLPNGKLAVSMTTLLASVSSNKLDALEKWKQKVGATEAATISLKATTTGTRYHKIAEDYLQNRLDVSTMTEEEVCRFQSARSSLDRIDNIRHTERSLYSEKYLIAGTADAIADFDGVPSIIDHKTSRKLKREEWIMDYFIQKTGYALMYEEMTGQKIEQIVTIISVEDQSFAQVFKKRTDNYREPLLKNILEYYKNHG